MSHSHRTRLGHIVRAAPWLALGVISEAWLERGSRLGRPTRPGYTATVNTTSVRAPDAGPPAGSGRTVT